MLPPEVREFPVYPKNHSVLVDASILLCPAWNLPGVSHMLYLRRGALGLLIVLGIIVPCVTRTSSGRSRSAGVATAAAEQRDAWIDVAQKTHARFTGRRGTLAQFGDSITVTRAFWSPLPYARKNAPPAMQAAFNTVRAYLAPECWQEWKGASYGSEGGKTSQWAEENLDTWLQRLNPEVASIMFGTNDLQTMDVAQYQGRMRRLVRRCLDNGTVVILSTIPPRHGFVEKAAAFAAAVREISRDLRVPLIDFHAEILKRRPDDWDGALDRFAAYDGYDVPTLLARDGVHPSAPKRFENDYSAEALRGHGYALRNYLTLTRYAEVIDVLSGAASHRRIEGAVQPPSQAWFPKAPPLPLPKGPVLRVSTVDELFAAAARVGPGGTILVADGQYRMPRRLEIRTDGVTLRGASGRRERVVLDGEGVLGELLAVTACSDVTIADLTVQNVRWNGIKIDSETGVQRLTLHNCILHNIWQRAVKGVKVPEKDRERLRPQGCRVQYCLFYNDRPKRFEDDPADTAENFGGNYVGGIDVMYVRGWTIRDNVFVGIKGRTGSARGAIFVWHESQDCIIERNVILDCDSGICLGNSSKPDDVPVHCARFLVRNNFVTRAPENGILADYTRDCKILNNTVHDPHSRLGRLIRLVHDNEGLLVANNLLSGPPVRNESSSRIILKNNLAKDLTAALVDPEHGNLRLTARAAEAIDTGVPLPEVTDDIDGKPRSRTPDIGASEYVASPAPAGAALPTR